MEKMETKHTPLPWFAEALEPEGGRKIYSGPTYDEVICDVHDWEESEGRANAEFIVRACNSHYELVRALRGVIHHNNAIKPQFKLPDSLIEQVESALNEATKRSVWTAQGVKSTGGGKDERDCRDSTDYRLEARPRLRGANC